MSVPRGHCHLTADGDWLAGDGPEGATRLWPYTQSWRRPWRTREPRRADPVNAYVIGRDPASVLADLAGVGWGRPGDGTTHRTWIDGRPVRMADHTALGTRAERVHVRAWGAGGGCLLAAHDERGDARGHHVVVSWDSAREALCGALESAGYRVIAPTGVIVAAGLRGVPGDGRIWRIVAP